MELKLIHILGPVLATVAMLFYGRAMVNKGGRSINVASTFALMGGAILFRVMFGEGTFLDRICLILMDFGIAMIIDSRYLKANNSHPKVFWVPGLLALIVSFLIYFAASLFGWTVNSMFELMDPDEPAAVELAALPPADLRGEVLLELGPDDQIEELAPLMEKFQATYEDAFPMIDMEESEDLAQVWLVRMPEANEAAFLEEVKKDKENVDYAAENLVVTLDPNEGPGDASAVSRGFITNDPGVSQQWWFTAEETNQLHTLLKENEPKKKAIVAIVDTGVDTDHEDLTGVSNSDKGKPGDKQGHGTHCAGLAGAATNNGTGVASMNWEGKFIELRSYKALNDNGSGSIFKVARAIISAAEDGADVVSLSLGMRERFPNKIQVDAVKYALEQGCIVVAAAGNDYGEDAKSHSPSNIDGVIAVAAVDRTLHRSFFSNINTSLKMPLAAPGSDIFSTFPKGEYRSFNGTSMATPVVSGLMGIMRAYDPDITAEEAWKLARDTGQEIDDSHEVGIYVNLLKAVDTVIGEKSGS